MVGGWNCFIYVLCISILALRNRQFSVFTDTPKIPEKTIKQWLKKKWLKFVFRKKSAGKLLVTGNIGVNRVLEVFEIDKANVINFPFATDNDFFHPLSSDVKLERNRIRFLSVGRIDFNHKGQDVAIEAFYKLKSMGIENFIFLIAGEGEDRDSLIQMIKKYSLESNVQLLGWVEVADLPELYNSVHFLLHTSHEDPFPNSVLESLSCGLPVIGSDAAGSVKERVTNAHNGYVFPDNNVNSLMEYLEKAMNINASVYDSFRYNARQIALQWSVDYNIDTINSLID